VRGATGLPVIGVIPRIAVRRSPVAMIAEPRKQLAMPQAPKAAAAPPPVRPEATRRHAYTFLQSAVDEGEETAGAATAAPEPKPVIERTALSIPATAGVIAEAYGVLQTNIVFSQVDRPVKTLVFTSPLPGDGKTTTVVNLAVSLAQRGLRTLLIDGDLRRGVVHAVFGVNREPGLSEVLRGSLTFESVRRGTWVGERGVLDYVTSGKLSPNDHGLVTSDIMRELLARAREEYDAVIVDTPPVNIMTDAAVLGANADGVVVIARAGVTEGPALTYAVEQLRRVRARVLGVVLNDIDVRRDAAYDGSYKYFQAYEYSTVDS
jgi:protein-tyrosine kinase